MKKKIFFPCDENSYNLPSTAFKYNTHIGVRGIYYAAHHIIFLVLTYLIIGSLYLCLPSSISPPSKMLPFNLE